MNPGPSPDHDPLDDALRDAMRARWDRHGPPADLDAKVRTRFRRTAARRRTLSLAGMLAGIVGVIGLAAAFGAMLNRQSTILLQPVVTQIEVTRLQPTAVTEVVPVEATRAPFAAPHPILGDVRVRQAVAYCTDRAALIRAVYPWVDDPAALEADSIVPRGHWAYPTDGQVLSRYRFDPQQGQLLLDVAGWKQPEGSSYRANAAGEELALKLTTTDAAFRQTWAKVWEQQMADCGIRLLRLHVPAAWLFGESTGLRRRDFEVAAFAWVNESDPGGRTQYACDQIPLPSNQWAGQNYTGWCDTAADTAIRTATSTLDREARRAAYGVLQEELAREVPILPLFQRVMILATHPALENFSVDMSEPNYTWNAAQWRIPGRDTIVIGEDAEPASLAAWENAYVSNLIRMLITGADYTSRGFDYQPVMLRQMPTLENGAATNTIVAVEEGADVVDAGSNPVALKPGARLRIADGSEVVYAGGPASLNQLVVTYEFVDGLTWSDGVPVSMGDYELAYRIMCDPVINPPGPSQTFPACGQIAAVNFASDTAYTVTWKPGYQDPLYFLPPIGRYPAHQVLSDGRRLGDVPAREWSELPEIRETPLGVGPYRIVKWEYGKEMVFEANPYYFAGPPATPNIVVRFIPHEQIVSALAAGEVDVLDEESVTPEDAPALLDAQAAGKAHVYALSSTAWEHLEFALFAR